MSNSLKSMKLYFGSIFIVTILFHLAPFTQRDCRVWGQEAAGNLSTSDDHVFSSAAVGDPPYVPVNQPPVISSLNVFPSSGSVPLSVAFQVTASDPDGEIIEYDWDFDGNGSLDAVTTSNRISFIYKHAGVYAATVIIFDDDGASTGSVPVTIKAEKNKN